MKRLAGLVLCLLAWPATAADVVIGSKAFTESVILGDIGTQWLKAQGKAAQHRRELGGTRVLWRALRAGDIDAYVEYTGTLREEILAGEDVSAGDDALRDALAARGVGMTAPLGFDNTYALGMSRVVSDERDIRTISDLRRHPDLAFGFSNEFMDRADGWPGLKHHYDLPQHRVRGLDHDLAYRGLDGGRFQVTDLYATDAEIRYYDLRVLEDDRGYFPEYRAVWLYRLPLAERAPEALAALEALAGRVDTPTMVALNARVKLDREPEPRVAGAFLSEALGLAAPPAPTGRLAMLARYTGEHLALVAVSLSAAIVVALPLGVVAARYRRLGQGILGAVGIIQTIPALALLVFMIPLLGIGAAPAVAALFLYSLLPIVRNTCTGLTDIPAAVRESATALGLPPRARLLRVELPLASRSILAGIKISAVINVGTATLGALIGAGGLGQPILTGIRLDDVGLILQGAVPAALLAVAAQGMFELVERWAVPRGLRLPPP